MRINEIIPERGAGVSCLENQGAGAIRSSGDEIILHSSPEDHAAGVMAQLAPLERASKELTTHHSPLTIHHSQLTFYYYFRSQMAGKPFLIGITGGSGSGKTRIIHELRNQFPEDQLCIISQDEYYRAREVQVWDDAGYQNFDLPQSIDEEAFALDIKSLISGNEVQKVQYVFNNPKLEPIILTFKPAPVILVEGLFVFYFDEIRALLDLKIFIDAEDVIKLKRRIIRDAGERNYPLEDVLHRYEYHVLPSYRSYILPFKHEADLVINNHTHYDCALDVISALIEVKGREQ